MATGASSAAKASIDGAYNKLPWVFTSTLANRLSPIEASAHNATYTRAVDEVINDVIQKASNAGLFSCILGLLVPKEALSTNTFAVQRHYPIQIKIYTSLLPTGSLSATGEPCFAPGDPGTLRLSPDQVSSLLAVFQELPFLSDLLHENIGSGEARLAETIEKYEQLGAAVAKSLIDATQRDGSLDEGQLTASWFDLIQGAGNKKPWSIRTVEEVVARDDDKRVLAYRCQLCVSKDHCSDIQGCFNDWLKELQRRLDFQQQSLSAINDIFSARSQKQDAFSEASAAVPEAQRAAGRRGGQQQQADPAAAGAEPLNDRQQLLAYTIEKIRRIRSSFKSNLAQAAEVFIKSQIRGYEVPVIEALFSNGLIRRHGSANLALEMQTYLAAGDALQPPNDRLFAFISSRLNLPEGGEGGRTGEAGVPGSIPTRGLAGSRPKRTVGKLSRDQTGFMVSFFQAMGDISSSSDEEARNTLVLDEGLDDEEKKGGEGGGGGGGGGAATGADAAEMKQALEDLKSSRSLRRKMATAVAFIPEPASFTETNYLPSIPPALISQDRDTHGPQTTRDPRHIMNVYNPLHLFTSYMSVEAREDQLNPFNYFALNPNYERAHDPAKVPLHLYKQGKMDPAHERWQRLYRTSKSVTMGQLVNSIMSEFKVPVEELPSIFLGFPREVVKKGLVTLILPHCMPWSFSMLTLPDVIRHNEFLNRSTGILEGLAQDPTAPSIEYLEDYMTGNRFSMACLYMTCRMSVECMQNDHNTCPQGGKKDIGEIPTLSSKTDGDSMGTMAIATDSTSSKPNELLMPAATTELAQFLRAAFSMLLWKRRVAQYNITLRTQMIHRLALEMRMPLVRQPDAPNWQDGDIETRSQSVMEEGMDVFNAGGTNAVIYQRIIDLITRRKKSRVDVAVTQIPYLDLTNGRTLKNESYLDMCHRKMTRSLENFQDLLFRFCNRVPYYPSIIKEEPSVLLTRCKSDEPAPRPWLPMSKPLAAVFNYFNKQSRTERWSLFPNNLYENTSLLGEYVSAVGGIATRYMRISWAHSVFMLSLTASRTSMAYVNGRVVKPVNIALLGPPGVTKSYVYECCEQVQINGTAKKKVSASKKAGRVDANNNGETEFEHEGDPALFEDKKNASNPVFLERQEERKIESDRQVILSDYHTNVDKALKESANSKVNGSLFRKEGNSINMVQKSRQMAANKYLYNMVVAQLDRLFGFEVGASKSASSVLQGSKQSDLAGHGIGAQCALIADPLRIRQYLSTQLNLLCHLKPEHEPDLRDGVNAVLEILREASSYLLLQQNDTRRNARIAVLMRQVIFDVAIQAWMRHDPDAPNSRHCPVSSTGTHYCFRHFDEEKFFDFATKYLYATKEVVIYTLTLLTDIFEQPIKRDLVRYFFNEAYPSLNNLLGKYRKVPVSRAEAYDAMRSLEEFNLQPGTGLDANDPRQIDAAARANAVANADPEPEDDRQGSYLTDLNYVTITTPYSTYTALCEALGHQINSEFSFDGGQIMGALKRMEKETIDVDVALDNNRIEHMYPLPLVDESTGKVVSPPPIPLDRIAAIRATRRHPHGGPQHPPAPPAPTPSPHPPQPRTPEEIAAAEQMNRESLALARNDRNLRSLVNNFMPGLLPESANNSLDGPPSAQPPVVAAARRGGTGDDPMQVDGDPFGEPLDDLFGPAPPDALETLRLQDKFMTKARVPVHHQNFKAKLLTIETVVVGTRKHLQIIISHQYLRRQAAMAKQGTIWERSPVWKAIDKVLGKANLELYPSFIANAIETDPRICSAKKDYFAGGEYSYITGRTDASEDIIRPIIEEKRNDPELQGCNLPATMPSIWFSTSPVIKRDETAGDLILPTPLGDNPVDSIYIDAVMTGIDVTAEMAEKALKEQTEENTHLLRYSFDLDYYALFRRCQRLRWDITKPEFWRTLPIYNVVRKQTTGYIYPNKPIEIQARVIARSVGNAKESIAATDSSSRQTTTTAERRRRSGSDSNNSSHPESFTAPPSSLEPFIRYGRGASATTARDTDDSPPSSQSSMKKKQKEAKEKAKPVAKRRKVI